MEFAAVCSILAEWEERVETIRQFDKTGTPFYHNVKHTIGLFRDLAAWLRTHIPALRAWMNAYLTAHRGEIFVNWWGRNFHDWAIRTANRTLHPQAQAEWDRRFGSDPATCFSLAHRVATASHAKYQFEHCDDPTILAIHEGKPHESYGWSCDLCDEQEDVWRKKLVRDLQHCYHHLLNPERRKWFYSCWKWRNVMASIISDNWIPPHTYGTGYDREQFVATMRTQRPEIKGGTPCRAMISFMEAAMYYGVWRPFYFDDYKTEYDAFLLLWNCIDMIDVTLDLDLPRLQQIEEMF